MHSIVNKEQTRIGKQKQKPYKSSYARLVDTAVITKFTYPSITIRLVFWPRLCIPLRHCSVPEFCFFRNPSTVTPLTSFRLSHNSIPRRDKFAWFWMHQLSYTGIALNDSAACKLVTLSDFVLNIIYPLRLHQCNLIGDAGFFFLTLMMVRTSVPSYSLDPLDQDCHPYMVFHCHSLFCSQCEIST